MSRIHARNATNFTNTKVTLQAVTIYKYASKFRLPYLKLRKSGQKFQHRLAANFFSGRIYP